MSEKTPKIGNSVYTTDHTFERSELRVIRAGCVDDEEFLNKVATIICDLTEQRDAEKLRADMAEHRIRIRALKNS